MVVCVTGGGTLGHIYPALAVHQELANIDSYTGFWIGRNDPTERRIVEEAGLSFYSIPSGKLRRYFSLRTISDGFKVIWAIGSAYRILAKETRSPVQQRRVRLRSPVIAHICSDSGNQP